MKLLKQRSIEIKTVRYIDFDFDGDPQKGGYRFDADESFNPVFDPQFADTQRESYQRCESDPRYVRKEITEEVRITHPAIRQCTCGNAVELVDQYMGACQCDKCGQ